MEIRETHSVRIKRKPGPKPKGNTQQYVVMLEPEPAEWAKGQPGGLSDMVRRLLRQVYEANGLQNESGVVRG